MQSLSIRYSTLGDYKKALEISLQVYGSRKKLLGDNHPDTMTTLHKLGLIYSKIGDFINS